MGVLSDLSTIATTENRSGYGHFLNREETELERVSTFRDVAALPQARRFFSRTQPALTLSQQVEAIIDGVDPLHPLILQTLLPRAGAVEDVQSLTQDQIIDYVTRWPIPVHRSRKRGCISIAFQPATVCAPARMKQKSGSMRFMKPLRTNQW